MNMKNKPVSKKVSEAQYDQALKDYQTSFNKHMKLSADKATDVQKVTDKYADKLKAEEESISTAYATVMDYCEQNRDKVFGDEKSIKTPIATLGFRLGKPSISIKEDVDAKALPGLFVKKGLAEYLVTKQDLDKNKIIAAREDSKFTKKLEGMGLTIGQEESFYITLNK